jgi:hypothetical protein
VIDLGKMSVDEIQAWCYVGGGDEEAGRRWQGMDELARRLAEAEALQARQVQATRLEQQHWEGKVIQASRHHSEQGAALMKAEADRDHWKARAEAAEAVVAKLPKTADGVPITPGMELWGSLGWNNEPAKATLRGTYAEGYSVGTPEWGMNVRPEVECYSTREAAEAAKESPRD